MAKTRTFFSALALLLCLVLPSHTKAEEYQISDDGYAHVPLDFAFPYQGQIFTDSYMFSNGVVGFINPTNGFCCGAYDVSQPNPSTNFSLFVLQTDLIDNGIGTFTATGDSSSMTYSWNNIAEYGTNNLNTFSASIYSTGQIDYNYVDINLQYHDATIGYTGDAAAGQYESYEYVPPGTHRNTPSSIAVGAINLCVADPLYDPICPGYQEAYLQLQCSYDPLYDPTCQGYQDAYYSQQCYNNPLFDEGCPGYSEAFLQQQCSTNPLYDQACPGYATAFYDEQCRANVLYDSGCPGYEQAYYEQQCSINPLYDRGCSGYDAAYHSLQCSIDPLYAPDCDGYAQAYHDQQCSLNSLYDESCPKYSEAYYAQQCSIDPLFDYGCDGYQEAHDAYVLDQICIANSQADPRCPGYTTTTVIETSTGTNLVVSFTDPVSGVLESYSMGTTEPQTEVVEVAVTVEDSTQKEEPATKVENAKEAKEEAKSAAKELAAAKTVEAQQKAQASVLAMMGYVPGFGAYSVAMDGGSYEDAPFYQPEALPESKSAVRNGLAQQVLHTKMIMMQYEEP
jgi:hypothetical protein